MNKSDKKLEQRICNALTDVCHWAQETEPEFEWLTHQVNYKQFPQSLQISCIFTSFAAQQNCNSDLLKAAIIEALKQLDIAIKPNQIHFDNEQDCSQQHQGNWAKRLQQH